MYNSPIDVTPSPQQNNNNNSNKQTKENRKKKQTIKLSQCGNVEKEE